MMDKPFIHADPERLNCNCSDGRCFIKCLYFVLGAGVVLELLLGSKPFEGGSADNMWVHDVFFVSFILGMIVLWLWFYQSFKKVESIDRYDSKSKLISNKALNYDNYLKGGGVLLINLFLVTGCMAIIVATVDSGIKSQLFKYNMMVHDYLMYFVIGYIPFYYFYNRLVAGSINESKDALK